MLALSFPQPILRVNKGEAMKTTGRGHLFKRGGIYTLQYNFKGRRRMVSLKTADRREAERRRDELLSGALLATSKEKVIVHIAEARKLISSVNYPLDAVWGQYMMSSKRPDSSDGTLGNYERNWGKFKSWLNSNYPIIERINQVTKKEAELYAGHLWNSGISANTYNYHIQSLKLIFKVLCGGSENPFAEVGRKNEMKVHRKHFEKADVLKILAAVDSADSVLVMQRGADNKFIKRDTLYLTNKDEMRVLFYLGAWTGARLADCALMKRESVDLANNSITFTPIKTRQIQREVTIPIHPDLRRVLVGHMKSSKGKYLLTHVSERYQRNPDGVIQDVQKVLEHCGFVTRGDVEDKGQRTRKANIYGYHSFRHSFATFAANAGVPIAILAHILGDNIRTLEKYYIKVSDDAKQAAVNALSISIDQKTLPSITDAEVCTTKGTAATAGATNAELRERIRKVAETIRTSRGIPRPLQERLLAMLG